LIRDQTETAQAVYGQIRTAETLFENTRIAFGARYNTTSGNADATVWTLSGQHDFSANLYLRGQMGTSFRLPDAEELWLQDCCEVGNPNLQAEESENIELAIGGVAPFANNLRWEFIYFTREIENLIDIDFENPAFPDGIFANFQDKAQMTGWEFFAAMELNAELTASFDYTSNEAELANSNEQLTDIPKSVLKLGLSYSANQIPLELNLAVLNVGDVYDFVGGGVGRLEHGGYTVIDIGAAYYLDPQRRHRLGARIENALNETYASSLGRGRLDVDNSSYAYRNLGSPRSLHVTYSYQL
jgi:vitamin B12 transporter